MNTSCVIDFKSVSNGIKNSVKKKLTESKLFKIDGDIVSGIEESEYQQIVDEINKAFGENLILPYKGNVLRITEPSVILVQKYMDFFSEKFVLKPTVSPKSVINKDQKSIDSSKEGLHSQYKGTLPKEQFEKLSKKEQQTIIDQQNKC